MKSSKHCQAVAKKAMLNAYLQKILQASWTTTCGHARNPPLSVALPINLLGVILWSRRLPRPSRHVEKIRGGRLGIGV